jgi:hypothetical protein
MKSPKLPQHGGEGKSMGSSKDMKLPQHGGEGKSLGRKNDMKLKGQGDEVGSGRNLKVMAN